MDPKKEEKVESTKPEAEKAQSGAAQEQGKKGPSKKDLKKMEKEKQKQEEKEKRQRQKLEAQLKEAENDFSKGLYGDLQMIQSTTRTERKWTKVIDINDSTIGQEVLVRARIHSTRGKGNLAFIILRDQFSTIQAISQVSQTISKLMVKWLSKLPNESIVDLTGQVVKPKEPVEFCSQKVEIAIQTCFVVSRADNMLPLQISDASRPVEKGDLELEQEDTKQESQVEKDKDGKEIIKVGMKTRLDNRVIDLRTPAQQAIFRVSSGVCQLFREFLYKQDFVEIHTPKLIGGTSEGGANVFRLKYFDKEACLAQSPQLYKQMCINADFDKVFEIAPVFRAEQSFTHRHMCEFTGLDIEMAIKQHYFQALQLFGNLFGYIFEGLQKRYANELQAIRKQYHFEPFKFKYPVVKITFEEGIALLAENGVKWDPFEDLDTPTEKKLGEIVRKKYDTDFYMLHRYPKSARPFYTMPCKDDARYTNSYDMFMRGEEIVSGAQRLHDPVLLSQQAEEKGIKIETIQDYIDSFKYGSFPHAGMGVGLERVVFLYCALNNIRNTSLFPRDPKRYTP